jgi:hypothetical protein
MLVYGYIDNNASFELAAQSTVNLCRCRRCFRRLVIVKLLYYTEPDRVNE